MALSGTLADFGLPDIFQLLGHQQKTGVLELRGVDLQVRIHFIDGNVVKTEEPSRNQATLLGSLMVRAGAITAAQLEDALVTQQRTLRRIGDILVEMKAVERDTLKQIARLQTTETIYRLFMWRKGTYEFTPMPVEFDDRSYEPIRAESILMEGFRMVDEWPAVRRVIPTTTATFVVVKALPPPVAASKEKDDLLAGMADVFGGHEPEPASTPTRKLGDTERKIFPLVAAGRTVQEICDLSRMGDFEATKALATLVQNGILRMILPSVAAPAPEKPGFSIGKLVGTVTPVLTRVALYVVVAAAVGGVVRLASMRETGSGAAEMSRMSALIDKTGELNRARLGQAIETFRLEQGRYPETLDELVRQNLVEDWELSFPYQTRYAYRASADGWALALPLR